MLEAVRLWLRQISCFLLLSAVIQNLMPQKKEARYVRLFFHLLLVMLLARPLLQMAQAEVSDWITVNASVLPVSEAGRGGEIPNGEDALEQQYQAALKQTISQIVSQYGYLLESCSCSLQTAKEGLVIEELTVELSKAELLELPAYIEDGVLITEQGEESLKAAMLTLFQLTEEQLRLTIQTDF